MNEFARRSHWLQARDLIITGIVVMMLVAGIVRLFTSPIECTYTAAENEVLKTLDGAQVTELTNGYACDRQHRVIAALQSVRADVRSYAYEGVKHIQ